ncbi:hypothetical protein LZ32DRAFT_160151 [Colletotrichum eremochloae]|nr:hypothetical protein LZ32DRAFT_160151 [Colletotrichum eremochloae]
MLLGKDDGRSLQTIAERKDSSGTFNMIDSKRVPKTALAPHQPCLAIKGILSVGDKVPWTASPWPDVEGCAQRSLQAAWMGYCSLHSANLVWQSSIGYKWLWLPRAWGWCRFSIQCCDSCRMGRCCPSPLFAQTLSQQ